MELIRGYHNLRARHHGSVVTIGNFDGVHLGHQAVLGQLAEKAKLLALRRYSVDRVLCLRFDKVLANLPAPAFIREILIEGLGVRHLVVGDDFRFGHARQGDFNLLKEAGERHDFQVVSMRTFNLDGRRVSSTRVREALASGDMNEAEKLLGRPYRMCGRVAHGDKRGRSIGYPTVNIFLHRHATPVQGVFAVEMYGIDGEPVSGVANVGTRPTVDGTRSLLEVHLFDFDRDIYGEYVHVDFLHKLRAERRFESFETLKRQIDIDAEQARAFFSDR
jgi:riboflavin kinase/FMN adenylyltransferase